jgi:hypothetical protein
MNSNPENVRFELVLLDILERIAAALETLANAQARQPTAAQIGYETAQAMRSEAERSGAAGF